MDYGVDFDGLNGKTGRTASCAAEFKLYFEEADEEVLITVQFDYEEDERNLCVDVSKPVLKYLKEQFGDKAVNAMLDNLDEDLGFSERRDQQERKEIADFERDHQPRLRS